jgi:hypothetical protein
MLINACRNVEARRTIVMANDDLDEPGHMSLEDMLKPNELP